MVSVLAVLAASLSIQLVQTDSFTSVQDALSQIRELRKGGAGLDAPAVVRMDPGTYRIKELIRIGPEDHDVCFVANGPGVVIDGGLELAPFVAETNGLWRTFLPPGIPEPEQLYVNGRRSCRARSPNSGYFFMEGRVLEDAKRSFLAAPDDILPLSRLSRDDLSRVVVRAYHSWESTELPVIAVDLGAGRVTTQPIRACWPYCRWNEWKPRYVLENYREALDAPGEWFYERKTRAILYRPRDGESAEAAVAYVPYAEHLVAIAGARNVMFSGIEFRHAAYRLPPEGRSDDQGAAGQEAAIGIDHSTGVSFDNCRMTHLGQHAIWFRRGCRDCRMTHALVEDVGGSGVRVGDVKWEPSELPDKLTQRVVVSNCIFRAGGRQFAGAVGAWFGHVRNCVLTRCDISDFFYSGVSVGWTWWYHETPVRENEISYNHIHDCVQGVLADSAGIYTLGRSPGTRVIGNHIHDLVSWDYTGRGAWGLYADEGSSGILFASNLVHHVSSGGFMQHYGASNRFENNIFAFGGKCQAQRSRVEPHHSLSAVRNVFYWRDLAANGVGHYATPKAVSDIVFASNLWYCADGFSTKAFNAESWEDWRDKGLDNGSIVADPRFKDAENGVWDLLPESPAYGLGFAPWKWREAGVSGDVRWQSEAARGDRMDRVVAPREPPRMRIRNYGTDFEGFETNSIPTGAFAVYGENEGASIRIVDKDARNGKHALELKDAKSTHHAFEPFCSMDLGVVDGSLEIRYSFKSDGTARVLMELRDYCPHYVTGFGLEVRSNEVWALERRLGEIRPKTWYDVRVNLELSGPHSGNWRVTVSSAAGDEVLSCEGKGFKDAKFKAVRWLGFVGLNTSPSSFLIDDFWLDNPRGRETEIPDVTSMIQGQIDLAWRAGGGEVVVGPGKHRVNSLRLRSGVTLRLTSGAYLAASRSIGDYPLRDGGRHSAVIRVLGEKDVRLIGESGSVIDGMNCPNPNGDEGYRGPHCIWAIGSTNVVVQGFAIRDAGNYAIELFDCKDVVVRDMLVEGGHDGVHFDRCRGVEITGCKLLTGDDSVAGAGCMDVVVSNCVLNSACSPVRCGGRNVLITDCLVTGPAKYPHRWSLTKVEKARGACASEVEGRRTTGCFYQAYTGDTPYRDFHAGNIVVRNVMVANCERFFVSLTGLPGAIWQNGNGIADITFENVKVKGMSLPSVVVAREGDPLKLILRNCSFEFKSPLPYAFLTKDVQIKCEDVQISNVTKGLCDERDDLSYEDIPEFPSWRVEDDETRAIWGLPPLKNAVR